MLTTAVFFGLLQVSVKNIKSPPWSNKCSFTVNALLHIDRAFSSTQITLYLVSVCRHMSTRFVGLILPLCMCSMFVLNRLSVVISEEIGRKWFIPTVVPRCVLEVARIFSDRRIRSVLSGTVKFVFIMLAPMARS